jgi:hypothetical protein
MNHSYSWEADSPSAVQEILLHLCNTESSQEPTTGSYPESHQPMLLENPSIHKQVISK